MVFLVRADLKMTVGKMCAQCGHCVSAALEEDNPRIQTWKRTGEKKVALKVDSLEQLEQLLKKAVEKGLPCGEIHDAGHTQVDPGTLTVGWIGPWDEAAVDEVTGKLRLL